MKLFSGTKHEIQPIDRKQTAYVVCSSCTLKFTEHNMKYDDASWHYGGDFPEGQPEEHGGTHIALFLKWCFARGWVGSLHMEEEPDAIGAVVSGKMSATDFLFKYCDGKFIDEDLNEVGNCFTARYYGDDGLYLDDYAEVFGDLMYVAPEAAHDYQKFSTMLDDRYATGILSKSQLKS